MLHFHLFTSCSALLLAFYCVFYVKHVTYVHFMQVTQLQYHEHDFLGRKTQISLQENHRYSHQLNLKEKRT